MKKILSCFLVFVFFTINMPAFALSGNVEQNLQNGYKLENKLFLGGNKYLYTISKDNKMTLCLEDGKALIENVDDISKGIYIEDEILFDVKKNDKLGVISLNRKTYNTKTLVPFIYDSLGKELNYYKRKSLQRYKIAEKDGKLGIIKLNNAKEVTSFDYDFMERISYEFVKIGKNGEYGVFCFKKEKSTNLLFEDVKDKDSNLMVKLNDKWHYASPYKKVAKGIAKVLANAGRGVLMIAFLPLAIPATGLIIFVIYESHK